MDILKRIDELRKERGWTVFELTSRTNLSEYTVYSWYTRGSKPTIYALESVCEALGVTMAEFFTEINRDNLSPDQVRFLELYSGLTREQRDLVLALMKSYEHAGDSATGKETDDTKKTSF